MNELTLQLMSLQYELAMNMSSTLDLGGMLRAVLETLLRQLDARNAAVFRGGGDSHRPLLCEALPRGFLPLDDVLQDVDSACRGDDSQTPIAHPATGGGAHRYVFALSGFGALLFERGGPPLDPRILGALRPVMQRLGRAAQACETHDAVEAAHRRFDTLVATLPDVVIFEARLEPQGTLKFDFVSPRARDVLGVEADELIRSPEPFISLLTQDDRERLTGRLRDAARQTSAFELRACLADTSSNPKWLLIAGSPRPDADGKVHWSGFVQDVTASELLVATKQAIVRAQLNSLLEAIGDAAFGTDAEGRITHWNQAAQSILGYSQSQVIGTHLALLVPERLRSSPELDFKAQLASVDAQLIGRLVEFPALHADGREIPAELLLNRSNFADTTYFFGVLRDVSERRRAAREREIAAAEEQRLTAALLELGRILTESHDLPIDQVTEIVATALDVERASIWSSTSDGLRCRDLHVRNDRTHSSGAELRGPAYEPYFAGLREYGVINAPDAATHPLTACFSASYLEPGGIVSMLHVPLTADGAPGVLRVESSARREWRPSEIRFCIELCNLVSRAIERELRNEANARHEAILSSIGDAAIACDLEGRITLLNPMAEVLTGWSAAEAVGRPLSDVFQVRSSHLGTRGTTHEDQVVPSDPSLTYVRPSVLVRRNADTIPISQSASPIIQGNQQTGVVLTFRDVSADEAARNALEQQFRQLQSIGEAIPDLVFTIRTDGRIRYVQSRPSPDLLLPFKDVDGVKLHDVFEEDLAKRLLDTVIEAAATSETKTVEYDMPLPRGLQHFEARMARIGEDEVTAIVRNITRDREREALLAEQRERLQIVLSSASVILYSAYLPSWELEYASESVKSVLGYTPEEFTAPGFWETLIHPDDRDRLEEEVLRSPPPAGSRRSYEFRHLHADGTYRWMRDDLRVLAGENGRPDRAIGATYDITERKRAERRLQSSLSLQQNVSEISTVLLGADLRGIDRLVELALGRVARFANAERAYVFLAQDELMFNTHEWCADGVEPQIENLQGIPFSQWRYFMGALEKGQALVIPSVRGLPPEAATEKEALSAQNIETLVAVPLNYRDDLRGFVGIDNPHVENIDDLEDLALPMRIFAEVVAGGIERAEDERSLRALNERIEERVRRQRALLSLSATLPNARARDSLYVTLGEHLVPILGSARVSLMLRDASDGKIHARLLDIAAELESASADGWIRTSAPERLLDPVELRESAVLHVLETGKVLSTLDTNIEAFPDWRHLQQHYGLDQIVMIPWSGVQGIYGCFNVAYARDRSLTREDVEWVEQVGALIGAHIAAHEAREALERLNLELEARIEERTLALRSSDEQFQELFQQAPQAMLLVDAEGQVVRFNLRALDLFKIPLETKNRFALECLIPEAEKMRHGDLVRSFFKQRKSRRMGFDRPLRALCMDGSSFFAEIGLVTLNLRGTNYVVAGVTDVTERIEARDSVLQSLREKETMLQEIHHRVKNNLQIISSILMLQSEQISAPEFRAPLTESVMRVRSMALIHQQLYGVETLDRIDLGDYARALSESLRSVLKPSAKLCVNATAAPVTINDAVPLGLILNELITNAFKYGTRPGEGASTTPSNGLDSPCDVEVEIDVTDGVLRMAVCDSGPGLPIGFDIDRATSLGLHLVRALTRQLRGKFFYDRERRSRFVLTCPISSAS